MSWDQDKRRGTTRKSGYAGGDDFDSDATRGYERSIDPSEEGSDSEPGGDSEPGADSGPQGPEEDSPAEGGSDSGGWA